MKRLVFLLILMIIPSVYAFEFTQNTTFNNDDIVFHFPAGTVVDDFQIISDGIILNENHRLVFVVEGGVLDITFHEWTPENNVLGMRVSAAQDVVFKITVDGKKKALETGGEYYIDTIPLTVEETNVSYVDYGNMQEDVIIVTVKKDKWYESKFAEFEYNTRTVNGKIIGDTFGITYVGIILFVLLLIILVLVVRR